MKWVYGLALVGLFLGLSACSSKNKAQKVAEDFLQAYYVDFDFEKARSLATEDSYEGINYKENMAALSPFAKAESPQLTIVGVEIDPQHKEQAVCLYKLGKKPMRLPLQKHEGKWKVDTDQENIEGEGGSSSSSGVENKGFAAAATSENLPESGPGTRAREKQKAKEKK